MPAKRNVQLRSCSLCGRTGHNRARCKNNIAETKIEKKAKPTQKNKLSTKKKLVKKIAEDFFVSQKIGLGKPILVRSEINTKSSPHIINLKRKEETVWDKVGVYQEKGLIQKQNVVVDFGQMVKKANAVGLGMRSRGLEARNIKIHKSDSVLNNNYKKNKQKININSVFANLSVRAGAVMDKQKLNRNFTKIKNIILSTWNSTFYILHSTFRNFNYKKLAYASLVLLILISLPFPAFSYYNSVQNTSARIVEASTNAFLSLQSSTVAAMNYNIPQAQFDLNEALISFGEANTIVDKEHQVLQYVAGLLPVVGTQVTSRQHLLVAGHHLALGNTYLVKGLKEVEDNNSFSTTDKIKIIANHLSSAIPQYEEALADLSAVDSSAVPVEYQESFNDFKVLFTALVDDMNDIVDLSDSLDLIFGSDQLKRYLLVFQNNSELRPTGGFMGSFAIMDVQKGKITNLDIPGGGTYDLQGQLNEYLKPPLPLQLSNDRWEFQDANWFPDFPASAKKIAWFYEHGRGTTVDGVIALNASVLERLLSVLGPVTNSENNLTLASDNVLPQLQYKVEVDYDKEENKPKEILSDLASQFLNSMTQLDAMSAIRLLSELNEALTQKEIQVYFNDSMLESKMKSFGWAGEIINNTNDQDYLYVVNTNIHGQKSDAKIKQTIEHQAVIDDSGSILDTVVITREHTGTPGEMFFGVNNVDYIRVYVPAEAELVEAGGFVYPPEEAFYVPEDWYKIDSDLETNEKEINIDKKTGTRITSEFGKTAFGNWTMTAPGQISKVYFTYKLPFKVITENNKEETTFEKWKKTFVGEATEVSRYSLFVQKQSGIDSDFNSRVIYPANWTPIWQENENLQMAVNGAEFSTRLKTDDFFGLIMEKNN
ncbi:MAG: DUF4012 domain-containing protein [Candidatus Magasanikiibacteriota bacterium]